MTSLQENPSVTRWQLRGATGLVLFLLLLLASAALFSRPPSTGFVFDEQEALLGNPYLIERLPWMDAFSLDFWGRTPQLTIGSYRPLPNLLWRLFAGDSLETGPFGLTLLNLALHALVAFSLFLFVRKWTGRFAPSVWAALWFVSLGVAVESVSCVVGVADLLVALFGLLSLRLSISDARAARWLVVAPVFLGLLSKETMVALLPMLPCAALLAPRGDGLRRRRFLRTVSCVEVGIAASAGLVVSVLLRKRCFPVQGQTLGAEDQTASLLRPFLHWFSQPRLPVDAMNNPLLAASLDERWATSAQIFAKNTSQVLLPRRLLADYSYPQEPVVDWGLIPSLGALLFVGCVLGALFLALRSRRSAQACRSPGGLLALGLLWWPLTYFPVSNALIILPTIRAERLLYVPALGLAFVVAGLAAELGTRAVPLRRAAAGLAVLAIAFSAVQARLQAASYASDVSFWLRASSAAPGSAKAHLNYGVMVGARGDMAERARSTQRAVALAPTWSMAHVYLADALCRSERVTEALPHYLTGLSLEPDSKSLSVLALQCLWDTEMLAQLRPQLDAVAARHSDSWLAFLLKELDRRGEEESGIPAEYRERGYNQPARESSQ